MLFDNLFPALGAVGTSVTLLGLLGVLALPVIGALACPGGSPLRRTQPRGR